MTGSQSLLGAPKMVMLEDLRLKPKVEWRPQEVRARNVDCLLRKTVGSEQSQPMRESSQAATSNAGGAGLPKPAECTAHSLLQVTPF